MYTVKDVHILHLEVTTRCNAACPQCPRNYESGAPNEQLPSAELTIRDIETILDRALVQQLQKVYLCGTFDEAADILRTEVSRHENGYFVRLNADFRRLN
jgi:hypothetical protein